MNETTKTLKLWGEFEHSILTGKGIDIGCGPDPVAENVRRFDLKDGDENYITKYVKEEFDFVYSSHCLEHMYRPMEAIQEWWKLVRVGGHLILIVPDEDLYEQGGFPSRFNPDHKATFTISKQQSWSPVSINVLDLVSALPCGRLISLVLQDQGYDRRLMRHGKLRPNRFTRLTLKLYGIASCLMSVRTFICDPLRDSCTTFDQTLRPSAVAQIQCIVQKGTT